jgi:hypothetical protein
MEVLKLSLLQPYDSLPFDLYHASGNILLRRGTPLKTEDIEVFRLVGIEKVYALAQGDSSYEFRRSRARPLPTRSLRTSRKAAQTPFSSSGPPPNCSSTSTSR